MKEQKYYTDWGMSSARREEFAPFHVPGKEGQLFTRRKTKFNVN